jgi:hypothetical protein
MRCSPERIILGFIVVLLLFGAYQYGRSVAEVAPAYIEIVSGCPQTAPPEKIIYNTPQLHTVAYNAIIKHRNGSTEAISSSAPGVAYRNTGDELLVLAVRDNLDCSMTGCYQKINEMWELDRGALLRMAHKVTYGPGTLPLMTLHFTQSDFKVNPVVEKLPDGIVPLVVVSDEKVSDFQKEKIEQGILDGVDSLTTAGGVEFPVLKSQTAGSFYFTEFNELMGVAYEKNDVTTIIGLDADLFTKGQTACEPGRYLNKEGTCVTYCNSTQVLGEDGNCYGQCEGLLCESERILDSVVECPENGLVLTSDGDCYPACGTMYQTCKHGYCFQNSCIECPMQTVLWKDGTCRYRN